MYKIFHSLGSVFLLHVFGKSVQLAYERVFGRKVVDATYVQPVILGLYLIAVCFMLARAVMWNTVSGCSIFLPLRRETVIVHTLLVNFDTMVEQFRIV